MDDEQRQKLHDVSGEGVQTFVAAFQNVDFQAWKDSATDESAKKLIGYVQKLYETAKRLLDEGAGTLSATEIKSKIEEVESLKAELDVAQALLDDDNIFNPALNATIGVPLTIARTAVAFQEAYLLSDGDFWAAFANSDFISQLIDSGGRFIGYGKYWDILKSATSKSRDIVESASGSLANSLNLTTFALSLIDGISDFVSLANDKTYTEIGEKAVHGAIIALCGLAELIPGIGTVVAVTNIIAPELKETLADLVTDMAVNHEKVPPV